MPLVRAELKRKHYHFLNLLKHDISQVLYLPFDKDDGNYIRDRSGYDKHGTIYGAVHAAGKVGDALKFDGVNDYVSVSDLSRLFSSVPVGTISFWANHLISQTGGRGLVCFSDLKPLIYLSGDKLQVCFMGATGFPINNTYTNSYTFTINAWHHVAFVFNGVAGTYSLWLDGVALETGSGITLPSLTTGVEEIGRYAAAYYFNGLIDEVRIFNRALSQAEIQRIMNMRGL